MAEVRGQSRRVEIHLRIRTKPEHATQLFEFLRRARPYYESLGGVRVRLLRDTKDASRFVEVIEYATREAFNADEQRVAADTQMKGFLTEWRELLGAPADVEVYEDVTDDIAGS